MKQITSRDNQTLKLVRKIRDGKISDKIFIEGKRLAKETTRSKIKISHIFVTKDFFERQKKSKFFENFPSKSIYLLPQNLFKSISDTVNPQGIILLGKKPEVEKQNFFLIEKNKIPLFILLHQINNPNNFGAICRTAEAAGIQGIIATRLSANAYSPKNIRASMGSVLRLKIWEEADFNEIIKLAGQKGLKTTCADINSEKNYDQIDWKVPRLLVFGSEAHGLTETERKKASEGLVIPLENGVESLNLAVSCGIILFEAKRQFSHH